MDELTLDALLAGIKSDDAEVRTDAWLRAGDVGAKAIKPLAGVIRETEPVIARLASDPKNKELELALESNRAANRAMWKIVRTAGAPGNTSQRPAVTWQLLDLIDADEPDGLRREVFWMLSEIGGEETIDTLDYHRDLVNDKNVREDARCMIERIPVASAIEALEVGLSIAPADYKTAMAQSLRVRGVKVDEEKYPCQKLVPTAQTGVKPVGS